MKVDTIMVLWHDKKPIFSVDFHQSGRLASSGADNDVKIWRVITKSDGNLSVEFLSSLTRHTKSVNAVRFSPDGRYLASGGDDGFIFIWKLNLSAVLPADSTDKEVWHTASPLRSKAPDIYDLAWSPDSAYLLAGSTDNSATIFHVKTGQICGLFEQHSHYVQGVAWDPLGEYILSLSSDRTLRVYIRKKRKIVTKKGKDTTQIGDSKTGETTENSTTPSSKKAIEKWDFSQIVNKREYSKIEEDRDKDKENKDKNSKESTKKEKEKDMLQHKMFLDENVNTFFRRLTWSPEGSLLFLPTGLFKATPQDPITNTLYIFSRHTLNKPLLHIPSSKPVIAVRCNPILFKLWQNHSTTTNGEETKKSAVFEIGYRIIFAVASVDCVSVYDTQLVHPIAYFCDLHCTNITDLTWSADGHMLAMSSTDGYCSVASFSQGELGVPLPEIEWPVTMKEIVRLRQSDEVVDDKSDSVSVDKDNSAAPMDISSNGHTSLADTNPKKETNINKNNNNTDTPKQAEKKPRRIAPTLVTTPK